MRDTRKDVFSLFVCYCIHGSDSDVYLFTSTHRYNLLLARVRGVYGDEGAGERSSVDRI